MSLKMTIEMADGTVESLAVRQGGPITIGRDPSCHVVLPSPDVSRRHLTVERHAASYRITDASANGTLIGESHVHRTTMDAPGGLPLRVGPYVIRLEPLATGHAPAPVRAAPPAAAPPPVPPTVAPPP
ncbi:MAG TPA: FHA domain-containing protein, partial [Sandaracinaceae bacterium LLY-WYZ-13_1]|nr:FHA domain-containing protein [Sandaracinaceae bacterium LLY-WYZ-13_1]